MELEAYVSTATRSTMAVNSACAALMRTKSSCSVSGTGVLSVSSSIIADAYTERKPLI
jgi:hypothetical protein